MNDSFILRDRVWREQNERVTLSSNATFASNSSGRYVDEEPDAFRTCFERDRDRIIHSKTFRRLKHKTQVFINPDGDHFITRMTHTLNVTQIGRSIAKTLGLNPDLTEAICLGHDVGHSPFGHTGEDVLNEMLDGGWSHSENSVRMLTVIEPLNLTKETINGIEKHPWRYEEPDAFRTCFERDRDRIIHSKTFRRLKHKTQVFINPDGDHFITRMTHTLNVTQIGRSIAKTLGLNPDLTEAICLGHDVGHSPFGHTGEEVLNDMLDGGWSHSENSVRMLSIIEPLNLTKATINGIEKHPWRYKEPPFSPEGLICRFAD